MTRVTRKYLAAAGAAAFAVVLGSLGTTALASSPGCAFGNGCATLHGLDAASHQVAMDAKYQNRHEILIGYPDNPGDGASSFDGVLHFTPNGKTTTYQDTALQVPAYHGTCSGAPGTLAVSGDTVTAASGDTLSVHSADGLTAIANSGNTSVTFSGTALAGNLVVDESYGPGCAEAWTLALSAGPLPATLGAFTQDLGGAISRSYVVGGVQFSDAVNGPGSFSFSGLPAGIVRTSSGELVLSGSSAQPQTDSSNGVTYTDGNGAQVTSSFELVVQATSVTNKNPDKPFYTFVYAPNGTWTSQCVTDVNGSGALKLEPCTLGRDKYQDFFALNGSGDPVQIADGITTYHIQNWLASVAKADSCLTDPSSLNPGTPQSDVTDKATSPAGRQLRTDGSCTSAQDLWSWNT